MEELIVWPVLLVHLLQRTVVNVCVNLGCGDTGMSQQLLDESYMLGERKSPNTIKEYSFLVSVFLNFLKKPLEKCTVEDIESLVAESISMSCP